jgi:hypothetical protein
LLKLKQWYGFEQKPYSATRKMRDSLLLISSLHSQCVNRSPNNENVNTVYRYTKNSITDLHSTKFCTFHREHHCNKQSEFMNETKVDVNQ